MNNNPKLAWDLNSSAFVHGCLEGAALSFCTPVHQNRFELDIRACRDTIHLLTNDPYKPYLFIQVQGSWHCLAVLSVTVFISWYTWISVDTTGSSHTAIMSGGQGLVLWLWSTCHFIPLFYIFGALIQAKREQHVLWQLTGSSATENGPSYCVALYWNFPWSLESSNSERCLQGQGLC